MSDDKMRSEFEAWFPTTYLDCNDLEGAWLGWQAALSQSESEVSQPVAFSNSTAYLYWQEGRRPTKDTLLYESPPDYEALKWKYEGALESIRDHAKLGHTLLAENEALKAENVRLQSECDSFKHVLLGIKSEVWMPNMQDAICKRIESTLKEQAK